MMTVQIQALLLLENVIHQTMQGNIVVRMFRHELSHGFRLSKTASVSIAKKIRKSAILP